jgi:hypothetical protein
MSISPERRRNAGSDSVFVIPVGPNCQPDFVADTIESIRYFAPMARIILVDDSRRGLGDKLGEHYQLTVVEAPARGVFGGLYLNLSAGFQEALRRPFRILVRFDTDALVAGSDFETKAIELFNSDSHLGSLGSFRIGYDCIGIRNADWARRRIFLYLAVHAWTHPRAVQEFAGLLLRARKHGYTLGDSIQGGAAIYRYEAVAALDEGGLLGRANLSRTGLQEDYIFGMCLYSVGYHLGEFGNRFDDLPMGVAWRTLPAAPQELLELGKSIIHSTKKYETMDEQAIRNEFRSARQER